MIYLSKQISTLDPRLRLCAELVRAGCKLADIGTDHAYLPCALAQSGKISSALACDINEKPLESGQETINRCGVGDIVRPRLSNGLDKVSPDECDDIVIAGMGGELICSIIEKAPWLKNGEKHLILQPMTRPEALRSYLYQSGFEIELEQAVESERRLYTVMLAVYSGRVKTLSELEARVGALKPSQRKLDRMYIDKIINSLKKKQEGLTLGGSIGEAERLSGLIIEIEKFKSGGQV